MFFGGVIKTLMPDNTKAMILDPDALSPKLTPAFLDYVQGPEMFVDPARVRVRSPKDKPRVENQVAYVRESWFDGERFAGLVHARQSALDWCRDIAGARVLGTTRRVPRDVFELEERAAMLPPPDELYDVPVWVDAAKVHPDHHIQIAHALYSVPTRYSPWVTSRRAPSTASAPRPTTSSSKASRIDRGSSRRSKTGARRRRPR